MSTDDQLLRIRLEGRLEVLESASGALEGLDALLRAGNWGDTASATARHLAEWVSVQPRLEDAIEAAGRAEATTQLARLTKAKEALVDSMAKYLPKSSITRADNLEARLELWDQLARSSTAPGRGEFVANVVFTQHTFWWLAVAGLSLPMFMASQLWPGAALCAVGLGMLLWGQREVNYRLYADSLVIKRGSDPESVFALDSFEEVKAHRGATLRGLVDVVLIDDERISAFCSKLNRLAAERIVLRREAEVLARFSSEAGRWLEATIKPARNGQSVEVIKFEKDEGASVMPGPDGQAPIKHGWALLCDQGLLFVPQLKHEALRSVLFDTGCLDFLKARQRAVVTLPAELVLEKLEELGRRAEARWLPASEQLEWRSVSKQEQVELPAGQLSVTVDDASRAMLKRIWS